MYFVLTQAAALKFAPSLDKHSQFDRKNYRAALLGSEWEKVRIEISVLGNKNSRNFIMNLGSPMMQLARNLNRIQESTVNVGLIYLYSASKRTSDHYILSPCECTWYTVQNDAL